MNDLNMQEEYISHFKGATSKPHNKTQMLNMMIQYYLLTPIYTIHMLWSSPRPTHPRYYNIYERDTQW